MLSLGYEFFFAGDREQVYWLCRNKFHTLSFMLSGEYHKMNKICKFKSESIKF